MNRVVMKLSAQPSSCPRLFLPGSLQPLEPRHWKDFSRKACHATRLEYAGSEPGYSGLRLGTPEHLIAALALYPEAPLEIICEGEEIPFMDGSAQPFLSAVENLLGNKAEALFGWKQYACNLEWEESWEGGGIKVIPAKEFHISYRVRRGDIDQTAVLRSSGKFKEFAIPARSFLFYEDYKKTVSESDTPLWKGAQWDSGLLLAESRITYEEARARGVPPPEVTGCYPLLNSDKWRVGNELAWHKILDLVGDLGLLDLSLPRLWIEVENGGHFHNHLLLDLLQTPD